MTIEHPLVTQLHTNVVLRGNWSQAEQLLDKFSSTGLFSSYLQSCQPYATFKPLHGTDADGDVPCPRGGHAMCIDPVNDHIYLHGGFDGEKCLDDFWVYDVKKDKWNVLSFGTSQELNAPGPRSRHKMVFDTKTSSIYLLGRLTDSDQLRPTSGSAGAAPGSTGSSATAPVQPMRQLRQFTSAPSGPLTHPAPLSHVIADENFCSEFYRYHTRGVDRGKWDFLSFDTAVSIQHSSGLRLVFDIPQSSGGPPLVFDHQMALDSEAQMLYVFGGRIVDGEWDTVKCAGMYCYNVRKSKWSCVMYDFSLAHRRLSQIYQVSIAIREHSARIYSTSFRYVASQVIIMMFNKLTRTLYATRPKHPDIVHLRRPARWNFSLGHACL